MKNLFQIRHTIIIILCLFFSCQSSNNDSKLGQVNFEVQCKPEAKPYFEKGLLYLHSFEYAEARVQFLQAQQKDPEFLMAYWGELMAYNQPLFNKEFLSMAKAVFNKLGTSQKSRLRLAKSDIERDMFQSVELLYGKGTKPERDKAYRDFLAQLKKKYEGNHEVATFYALSILGSPQSEKSKSLYDKAANVALKVLDENPDHPGALHYLIHAYDRPEDALSALDAADRYAQVAKDATHALHMPSHIYMPLGKWHDVVNSNIDSWNASVRTKKNNPKRPIGFHSLSWLQYGLLQIGEKATAKRLMHDIIKISEADPSILARTYLISMKGNYLVESNEWDEEIADVEVKIDDLHVTKKSGFHFIEGYKAYLKKDQKKMTEIIKTIEKNKYAASLNMGDKSVAMCNTAGNPNVPPNKLDIDLISIYEHELKALMAKLDGDKAKALRHLEKGTQLFEKLNIASGPPVIFKPVHEMYSEMLEENKDYKKALEVLESYLKIRPKKLKTLQGIERLAEQLGEDQKLQDAKKDLAELLKPSELRNILSLL